MGIKHFAAFVTGAVLLTTAPAVATGAPVNAEKPHREGSISRTSDDPAALAALRGQMQPKSHRTSAAHAYPDSLVVYSQNYTRSPNADCEDLLGQLEIFTGTDSESGTGEWSSATVEWQVATPYGANASSGDIYSDGAYEFDALFWCPELDGFGSFDLEVQVTYYDIDGFAVGYDSDSAAFIINRPATASSKVTYTKRKYASHGWAWDVRATRAGRAWAGKKIVMQAKLCGGWQEMFVKRANSRGRATFTSNPKAGWNTERFCGKQGARIPFRFAIEGNSNTRGDVSPTFRVTRR